MKGAKKKVLFQPSTGRVTRATTRGENHQPRSAGAPRLGDLPEREQWELAQNQPGQVDILSEKNHLDQYTEMEGAAGGKNLPRTSERESSHQLHPEIDRNSSFQGPRPKDVRLDRWNLKFDGSGRSLQCLHRKKHAPSGGQGNRGILDTGGLTGRGRGGRI